MAEWYAPFVRVEQPVLFARLKAVMRQPVLLDGRNV